MEWCSGGGLGLGRVDVLGQGGLGDLDECVERRDVVDGHVGQDLAVDLDAGQAVNDIAAFNALVEVAKAALPEDVNAPKVEASA